MSSQVKNILKVNVAIICIIYLLLYFTTTHTPKDSGLGLVGFILSFIHVGANFLLASAYTIASVTAEPLPEFRVLSKAFWLSTGLVLLISFPVCLVLS
jgi:hypothetical protein